MSSIAEQIAQELNVKTSQVITAITLLDDGATVPFIARYRKEATQGLDDNHLRELATRLAYIRDVEARRQVILTSIKQQDKLTAELAKQIANADNKTRLEDLYLPYKPKRRTKGQIAIEAGIEPLANSLFNHWQLNPEQEAQAYLDKCADVFHLLERHLGRLDFFYALRLYHVHRFAQNRAVLQTAHKVVGIREWTAR